jgi:hypothetical protein
MATTPPNYVAPKNNEKKQAVKAVAPKPLVQKGPAVKKLAAVLGKPPAPKPAAKPASKTPLVPPKPKPKVTPDFKGDDKWDDKGFRSELEKKQAAAPGVVSRIGKALTGDVAKGVGLGLGGGAATLGLAAAGNKGLESLMKTHGDAVGKGAIDEVGNKASQLWDKTKSAVGTGVNFLKDKGTQALNYAKENPGTVAAGAGAALGAGALLSYLLRNRKKRRAYIEE